MLAVHEEGVEQAGLPQLGRNTMDVVILGHLVSSPENSCSGHLPLQLGVKQTVQDGADMSVTESKV